MCPCRELMILLVLLLIPLMGSAHAQEPDEGPLVVFVLDERLETASPFHTGASGLSELQRIFERLGARTTSVRLSQALPKDAHTVVIARPMNTLPVSYVARLWVHLANGKHLLWAVDPVGHNSAYPDQSDRGLHYLMALDYGVSVRDSFVLSPWFNRDSIADPVTSFAATFPESTVAHPIVQPLLTYDLHALTWGARAITIDPFGRSSYSVPLLHSRSDSYGKESPELFDEESISSARLERNPATDPAGEMLVGVLSENLRTGSRIIVLGDSEMLQNGFGLAYERFTGGELPSPDNYPLHAGNQILVQRLIAWLLEIPIEDWPALPSDFTWLLMNGLTDDWADVSSLVSDATDVSNLPKYDIVDVKAVQDDSYLYFLIETDDPIASDADVVINLGTNEPDQDQLTILAASEGVRVIRGQELGPMIDDAVVGVGQAFELRLPRRIVNDASVLNEACLCVDCVELDSERLIDCVDDTSFEIPTTTKRAPVTIVNHDGPIAILTSTSGVILRSMPNINSEALELLQSGHRFAVTGRDEAGDWMQVQDARYAGWIASFLLVSNGDLMDVPVVAEP